ncbi:MAG: protein kinase, partial [Cyanobacteria bacterium J06648_11]
MAEPLIGQRYRIERSLSSGGFSDTFLAEDTQMPSRRRCVIKRLRPTRSSPETFQLVRERFSREAAILEDLGAASDRIPQLYGFFEEDGWFYLVQEWIAGATLTEKVQSQGRLGEGVVRDVLVDLLNVLSYVHDKGIVHRDLKPDNIILRDRD